jgi:hypothetical protein
VKPPAAPRLGTPEIDNTLKKQKCDVGNLGGVCLGKEQQFGDLITANSERHFKYCG